MPLTYVPPEMAFTVSVGGSDAPVYHVYNNGNISDRMTYWYTFDEAEGEDNEFDIRELPTYDEDLSHEDIVGLAFYRGLVRINNNQLITVGGE
jgi:hypothetical protein